MGNIKIENLIKNVKIISQKYDEINKQTGKKFNIFKITKIADKEVRICRLIYELINPEGCHYQGWKYLKLFVEQVLGYSNFIDDDYKKTKINRELLIEEQRRIDLCIEIADHYFPIEVKINAEDGNKQCSDYIDHFLRNNKNCKLYYLTLYGDWPSKESAGKYIEINPQNDYSSMFIKCISFRDDIYNWVRKCIQDDKTMKTPYIRENLFQFLNVIEELTNKGDNSMNNEILENVLKTKEDFIAAKEIANALEKFKICFIKELIIEIKNRIENENVKTTELFKYNEDQFKFSNEPGFNIIRKQTLIQQEIVLVVGVSGTGRMWVGLPKIEGQEADSNVIERFCSYTSINGAKMEKNSKDWYGWFYVCDEEFKNDECLSSLIEQSEREKFIGKVVFELNNLCNAL